MSSLPPPTPPIIDGSTNIAGTIEVNPRAPPKRGLSNVAEPKKYSGIFGTTSNLVNSIVGAGIIGMPYAFRESGMVTGILLLILVGWMTDKTLRMMIETAYYHPKLRHIGVLTYEDLISIPFGRYGRLFISFSMFIVAYGAMTAYLLIIKDTVPAIMRVDGDGFVHNELIMLLTSMFIMLPLALLRDMSALSFTSLISVLADVFIVVFMAIYTPVGESVSNAGGFGEVLKGSIINSRFFMGLGVISMAMACQHSAFIVSHSLQNRTSKRWSVVTGLGLTISTILCITLALIGYLGFLDATEGDILNNFDPRSTAASVARALLAVTMFFTYPMESFVARHVVVQLLYNGDMDNKQINPETGEEMPEAKFLFCIGRREKVTIGIYILVLIPALIVDDLGPVLSISGCLGASLLAYIGPGLMYLGINGDAFLQSLNESMPGGNKATAPGSIELPVVGDANATMETASGGYQPKSKPWWYYVGLYPIWCGIAHSGGIGTRMTLEKLQQDSPDIFAEDHEHEEVPAEVIGPCKRDYYMSIFFIVFGVISAVVGLATNIIVIIHEIWYQPF